MLFGGITKANADADATDAQAQADQLKAQQAYNQLQAQANATEASAAPALATAQAATFNAQVAQQQAEATLAAAAENERRYRVQAEGELATERVGLGGAGRELSGSALEVLSRSASQSELNALTLRHNGIVQANAYLNAKTLDQFQAIQAQAQGDNILKQAQYIRSTAAPTAAGYQLAAQQALKAGQTQSTTDLLGGIAQAAGSSAAPAVASSFSDMIGLFTGASDPGVGGA